MSRNTKARSLGGESQHTNAGGVPVWVKFLFSAYLELLTLSFLYAFSFLKPYATEPARVMKLFYPAYDLTSHYHVGGPRPETFRNPSDNHT